MAYNPRKLPKLKKLTVTSVVDFSTITEFDLPAGLITAAALDPTLLGGADEAEVSVTILAADIKKLNDTPIELVAQPDAGKAIIVDEIRTLTTYAGAAFTGSNNVEFRYTDGSGDKVAADLPYADLNIVSGTKNYRAAGVSVIPIRAAVVASVPSANPGGSSAAGTLKVTVRYHTVSLT